VGPRPTTGISILVNQATSSLWVAHSEEEEQDRQCTATVVALAAIGPKDELEAMMAAQLLAAHNATMECYRRAMLPEQTSESRSENLNQANKLSRTYAVLLDALNRHRGKGQQKVTVEHVHVHSGGPPTMPTTAWSRPLAPDMPESSNKPTTSHLCRRLHLLRSWSPRQTRGGSPRSCSAST
jgi:hypothetical protein